MLLHRKPNDPKMVYLDQFQWINLSLAYHQKSGGKQFAAALEDVQEAVEQNQARFPLSDSHVTETMKHGNLERRQRLARVMAEVSQGWSIAPLHIVTPQELLPELSKAFNKPVVLTPTVVFGQGIEFAFGAPLRVPVLLKLLNSLEPAKRQKGIELLAFLLSHPDENTRKPNIDKYNTTMNEIAQSFEEVRGAVQGRDRDLRQRAYLARQIYDDLKDRQNEFHEALAQLGLTFEDFLNLGRDGIENFYKEIPTLHAFTTLKARRNDQFSETYTANDLNDLSFLSVAIPYCDIVVTEEQWVIFAKDKGLDQLYNTVLISKLEELSDYL